MVQGSRECGVTIRLPSVDGRRARKELGPNGAGRRRVDEFDFRDERIALARNGFDEGVFVWRIAEDLTELFYGGVDIGVEVDGHVGRPQTLAESLAAHDFAGLFDEDQQNFMNFGGQLDSDAIAIEGLAPDIVHKGRKTDITLSKTRRRGRRPRLLLGAFESDWMHSHSFHL